MAAVAVACVAGNQFLYCRIGVVSLVHELKLRAAHPGSFGWAFNKNDSCGSALCLGEFRCGENVWLPGTILRDNVDCI